MLQYELLPPLFREVDADAHCPHHVALNSLQQRDRVVKHAETLRTSCKTKALVWTTQTSMAAP